jgi:glycerophosphoryl diester phosphodiesterase
VGSTQTGIGVGSPPREIAAFIWRALRARPATFALSFLGASALAGAVIAPVSSALIAWLVGTTGQVVIANQALVGFFLSPAGVGVLLVVGVALVVGSELGRASAIMVLAGNADGGRQSALWVLLGLVLRLPWLAALVARQVGLIAFLVLRGYDPNYIVHVRPPRFWVGLACAAAPAGVMVVVLARTWMRWTIAVPLCLLEGRGAAESMATSERELRGREWRLLAFRGGWAVGVALAGSLAGAGVALAAGRALQRELGGLTMTAVAAGAFLGVHALVSIAAGLIGTVGDGAISWLVYRERHAGHERTLSPPGYGRWVVIAGLIAVVGVASGVSAVLLRRATGPMEVVITAHRGASRAAPENTLAAIRAAIAEGADWAEIDVQLTSDGAVVVMHDTDLLRIAKDPRRVVATPLAELRKIDAGGWFDARFKGEQIPTLAEVLDEAGRGGLTLNIELKPSGNEGPLAMRVASVLREKGALERSVVTSLSTVALQEMRKAEPGARIGQILSASVGRPARLGADMLAMNAGLVNGERLAWGAGSVLGVHAWTVNDADQMTRLVLRGVRGVITDDAAAMVRRRQEWNALTRVERLLLVCRVYFVGTSDAKAADL